VIREGFQQDLPKIPYDVVDDEVRELSPRSSRIMPTNMFDEMFELIHCYRESNLPTIITDFCNLNMEKLVYIFMLLKKHFIIISLCHRVIFAQSLASPALF
jgi:hypothetical protein